MGMENITMIRFDDLRGILVALVPVIAIAWGSTALAQAPAPAASPSPAPSASPVPPAPAPSPAPPPAETKSPADTPSAAQSPPPPASAPVQTADPFGEEFTLEQKKVVTVKGNANWD